jgi:hypothetical protein
LKKDIFDTVGGEKKALFSSLSYAGRKRGHLAREQNRTSRLIVVRKSHKMVEKGCHRPELEDADDDDPEAVLLDLVVARDVNALLMAE